MSKINFTHPPLSTRDNTLFKKWKQAGQIEEIFHSSPNFVLFLHHSKLLSQIKVTRDTLPIVNGEPSLLVEGTLTSAQEVMKRFRICYSKEFQTTFVYDSAEDVYTYLDNGKGLQKHHPFLSINSAIISRLDDQDLVKVQAKAAKFVRNEPGHKRTHVLQIITSSMGKSTSHLGEILLNPRHAYLRMIAGEDIPECRLQKGDVYETGFYRKEPSSLLFECKQGHFRSPDPWEYMPCAQRYVTNTPLDTDEVNKVHSFINATNQKNLTLGRKIGFQLASHNCTFFVHTAAKQAGIELPTKISLPKLISRITPGIFQRLGAQLKSWFSSLCTFIASVIRTGTPSPVSQFFLKTIEKIKEIILSLFKTMMALIFSPLRACFGGFKGTGGVSLDPEEQTVEPPSWKLKNLFALSSYNFHLPGALQEWQKTQASTEIYNHPVKLTIVPISG